MLIQVINQFVSAGFVQSAFFFGPPMFCRIFRSRPRPARAVFVFDKITEIDDFGHFLQGHNR